MAYALRIRFWPMTCGLREKLFNTRRSSAWGTHGQTDETEVTDGFGGHDGGC